MKAGFNEEKVQLSTEELEKLTRFVGYGPFDEADVVFFGMEEGLGQYPIEAIPARARLYGNDTNTWLNGDWKNGYWDETGDTGYRALGEIANEIRREKGLTEHNLTLRRPFSPMLNLQARLLLALEQPEGQWFLPNNQLGENELVAVQQRENTLYDRNNKVKAALLDWRPLPRRNSNVWHYEFDRFQYLNAFDLKKSYLKQLDKTEQTISLESDDLYLAMLQQRMKVIRNVIDQFNFRLLISSGAQDEKEKLFKELFKNQNIEFEQLYLPNGKRYKKAVVKSGGRELTILITYFFNHQNGLSYEGIKQLYQTEVSPHLNKIN